MTKKKQFLHIIFPLIIGAIIYYVVSPDVIFVRKIDSLLGTNMHMISTVPVFIRNYLLDMLWAYALLFAIYVVIDNTTVVKAFVIGVIFSTGMELLQLTTLVKGTFDVIDIVVEIIAEIAAVLIIKNYNLREEKYEEKN